MSQTPSPDAPATPRDAASLILVRSGRGAPPRVLMGQRGAGARFMPSKFVFPGGALDAGDAHPSIGGSLRPACARRLALAPTRDQGAGHGLALARAAVRETFEEAGLAIGAAEASAAERAAAAPEAWRGFLSLGFAPATERLRFIFRAITPPTRPVRFDARFFLADVADVIGDLDDFSRAEEELAHLQWLTLTEARALDLPFITSVVLAEVEARLERAGDDDERPAPYFRHEAGRSYIDALA